MLYVRPEIEIIRFEETDIVTNSYETPIIPADGEEEPVKKKVIKLLQEAGAEIYTSAANGDITVVCGGNGTYEVITER